LSSQPPACLRYRIDVEPLFDAGQALFNAPTLLGGQAAKAGLSCASCHVNGRDNPHFVMAGVSGKPGTADVTSSFFSAARGNGRFDPVPIPDLAMPGKIPRKPGIQPLERFIRNLIVEEFAGAEPSPATLESLATYVRAIERCDSGDKTPEQRGLYDQLKIVKGALKVASKLAGGDGKQTELMIATARHQLGLISERYAGAGLKRERALLLKASRELQSLAEKAGDRQAITDWQERFDKGIAERLYQKQGRSLYNPALLAKHLRPKGETPSKR
jgi:hypothetical protein